MGEPDKLDEGDRRLVTALLELSPPIAQAVELQSVLDHDQERLGQPA